MKKAARLLKIVGIVVAILVATYWLLWCHDRYMEPRVAVRMASTFLKSRSLNLQEFDGPTVEDGPYKTTTYVWRSKDRTPVLELDVSPLGDLVCLYEVLEPKRVRRLGCLEPE